jgi:hypothetical protein
MYDVLLYNYTQNVITVVRRGFGERERRAPKNRGTGDGTKYVQA